MNSPAYIPGPFRGSTFLAFCADITSQDSSFQHWACLWPVPLHTVICTILHVFSTFAIPAKATKAAQVVLFI